jgi:HD-like signal output (HDOD) protein/CheY-like chemotaxis protein
MNPIKRILFVDDEPMILQGLQRTLRCMRNEWDMAFVGSGAEALEIMAKKPFDAVITDMRMQGMNGAELLSIVMKRYPKTIRLILSGHADKELILQCVGTAHQYLAKPCEIDLLKRTLQRATTMESTLKSEKLRALVSQLECLPSIPTIYMELVDRIRDPEVSLEDVGASIAKDVGLTAQILKLVNSAFFGLSQQLSTTTEAVSYLGVETVKSLLLSVHAFAQFKDVKIEGFSIESVSTHGLETAAMAKAIALAENAENLIRDQSFVAGMLHDVGKIILASNFTAQCKRAIELSRQRPCRVWEAEQEIFGADHAEVGGYLLGLWGLPVPVVEAIAQHHQPANSLDQTFNPLTAVHVANAFIHECIDPTGGLAQDSIDLAYLNELGLPDRLGVWRETLTKKIAQAA